MAPETWEKMSLTGMMWALERCRMMAALPTSNEFSRALRCQSAGPSAIRAAATVSCIRLARAGFHWANSILQDAVVPGAIPVPVALDLDTMPKRPVAKPPVIGMFSSAGPGGPAVAALHVFRRPWTAAATATDESVMNGEVQQTAAAPPASSERGK